jgi:hypothetical protein
MGILLSLWHTDFYFFWIYLQMLFFASLEMIIVSILYSVNLVYYIYWFVYARPSYLPEIKLISYSAWSFKSGIVFGLIWILLKILHLCSSGAVACNILFFLSTCLALVSESCCLYQMSLNVFPSLQFSWKSLRKLCVNSLNILPVKLGKVLNFSFWKSFWLVVKSPFPLSEF